jgi:hypothetical protein
MRRENQRELRFHLDLQISPFRDNHMLVIDNFKNHVGASVLCQQGQTMHLLM